MHWSPKRAVSLRRSPGQTGPRRPWTTASLASAAFLALLPAAHASFQPEVDLVPSGYGFISGGGCFPTFCTTDLESSNFQLTGAPEIVSNGSGGFNELFSYTATYTGAFTDTTPQHNLIGTFSVQGTDTFTIFGRNSDNETGTFSAQLTAESVHVGNGNANVLGGHQIGLQLDPNYDSDGTATFTESDNGNYTINSTFDVYADLSLDGSPFFYAGSSFPITESLVGVPEPGSLAILTMSLVLLLPWRWRHG